ncbi:DEAD-box ATP-dependent RNA helicase 7 [Canna indica]|uniref:DEAD-box ATP-dependent RNA helicase 7 n=1 Tax=Canna indica TaxID=4628 RepID=A0AAQ3L318_9LILI|nr:DEAD-box ATP-dependent RNA helicase 7 [Canna indica]
MKSSSTGLLLASPRTHEHLTPTASESAAAMPSLIMSDSLLSSEEIKESKLKKAKEPHNSPSEEKKSKKKKKHVEIESNDGELDSSMDEMASEKKKEKKEKKAKKEKKRKTDEEEEDKSDTTSESTEMTVVEKKVPAANGPAMKKPKLMEQDEEMDEGENETTADDPNALSNYRLSKVLKETLNSKGIKALFPIQAMTFDLVLDGFDLVGRARTGQGKTLAFVLPILESLTNGIHKESRNTGYGRSPSVLVLLPTRELANQVHADFEVYGGAVGLFSCCLYGGSPYRAQEASLKRGVDIIVGTPGRVKDHIVRGTLDLKALKFRVLDEADEMLNMGFVDDVELILGKVQDASKVQTLLFSATLPDWVKKISTRFLKQDKKTADLVGNEKLKASANVRHLVLPCTRTARPQLIPDVICCYSRGGRTIIFTETKEFASELAGLLPGARALHGDIVQAQREVILAGFRSGRFLVLVATNVAARGLDINDVQLIIQCEPPRDVEAYIHRSGRTGRAGNTGVAILLYEPKFKFNVSRIERESGVKFEHISAPQPADIAESAGSEAADAISNVSDTVIPVFRSQAEQLLSSSGLPAVDLLAKALAKAAGFLDIKKRSLLSSMENYVTLILQTGKPIYSPSFAFSTFRRFLPDEKIEGVKGLSLTADGMGAVFDVPADDVKTFLEGQDNANSVTIEVLDKLPPIQDRDQSRGGNSGRGRFGGGGFSGGRHGGNRFSGGRGGNRFSNGGGRGRFNRRN